MVSNQYLIILEERDRKLITRNWLYYVDNNIWV